MPDGPLKSVEIVRSGGHVPTYTPSYRVDTRDLPQQDRSALEALVAKLDLATLPDAFNGPSLPDAFTYTLTLTRGDTTRTISFNDMDNHPESLDELIEWVEAHGHR